MELTLMDHARLFFEERGTHPLDFDKAYKLWAAWAFSDMTGKNPEAQIEAMNEIERSEKRWL
jgi:hypothetical protein